MLNSCLGYSFLLRFIIRGHPYEFGATPYNHDDSVGKRYTELDSYLIGCYVPVYFFLLARHIIILNFLNISIHLHRERSLEVELRLLAEHFILVG